jgi:hypothetical protein
MAALATPATLVINIATKDRSPLFASGAVVPLVRLCPPDCDRLLDTPSSVPVPPDHSVSVACPSLEAFESSVMVTVWVPDAAFFSYQIAVPSESDAPTDRVTAFGTLAGSIEPFESDIAGGVVDNVALRKYEHCTVSRLLAVTPLRVSTTVEPILAAVTD